MDIENLDPNTCETAPRSTAKSRSRNGGPRPGAGRPRRIGRSNKNTAKARMSLQEQREKEAYKELILQHIPALSNSRGRSLTEAETRLLLREILVVLVGDPDINQTQCLIRVGNLTGISYSTLFRLYDHWRATQELLILPSGNRGAASLKHINHDTQLGTDHIVTIHRVLMEKSKEGVTVSSSIIRQVLKEEHSIVLAKSTMGSILHSLGYRYGKANFIGAMNDSARRSRIRSFLYQYSAALNQEDTVLVYTDESYVNSSHSRTLTWYNPIIGNAVYKAKRGPRLIILHAMTKYGILVKRDANGVAITASANVDEVCLTSEFIFETVVEDGDYHKSMNGEIYMKWLKNRLLPSFAAVFPGKRMCLVLDNASYHHVRGDDYITPSSMNKTQIFSKLMQFGISGITVKRTQLDGSEKERTLRPQAWLGRGGEWCPTLEEMRGELRKYITAHQELQQTEVYKLFKQHNHRLVYTPPYTPTCQPIEMMWAYIKNYVARKYESKRNMTMLREQTLAGCYGNSEDGHEGMTADRCNALINHCQVWMNSFIEQDSALSGNLNQLGGNPDMDHSSYDIGNDEEEECEPFPQDSDDDDAGAE